MLIFLNVKMSSSRLCLQAWHKESLKVHYKSVSMLDDDDDDDHGVRGNPNFFLADEQK